MRPNLAELMSGVNKTIMSAAMPIVQQSGDMQALWELATGSRLLSFVEQRWKGEFARLAGDNLAMGAALAEAAAALAGAGRSEADELKSILARSHCDPSELPSIDELERQHADLMAGLDLFILVHSRMDESDEALTAARQRIRDHLKQTTARDFEAAQAVIFF